MKRRTEYKKKRLRVRAEDVNHYTVYTESPIICYKYNKPIRNTILNFNKLVSDLDSETSSPGSWDCKDSNFFIDQRVILSLVTWRL